MNNKKTDLNVLTSLANNMYYHHIDHNGICLVVIIFGRGTFAFASGLSCMVMLRKTTTEFQPYQQLKEGHNACSFTIPTEMHVCNCDDAFGYVVHYECCT